MQRTRLQTTTESRAQAARRVSRKVLGDLESLYDWYGMKSPEYFRRLRRDLEVGLAYGAIRSFEFVLSGRGRSDPHEILRYPVTSGGGPNDRSGRIRFNPELKGGHFRVVVQPHAAIWDQLKNAGYFEIAWSSCAGVSRAGLQAYEDGGYSSGSIGVRRVHYRGATG